MIDVPPTKTETYCSMEEKWSKCLARSRLSSPNVKWNALQSHARLFLKVNLVPPLKMWLSKLLKRILTVLLKRFNIFGIWSCFSKHWINSLIICLIRFYHSAISAINIWKILMYRIEIKIWLLTESQRDSQIQWNSQRLKDSLRFLHTNSTVKDFTRILNLVLSNWMLYEITPIFAELQKQKNRHKDESFTGTVE